MEAFILEYEICEYHDYGSSMVHQTEYFETYDAAIDFIANQRIFLSRELQIILESSDKTFKVLNLYNAKSIDYKTKLNKYIEEVHKPRLNYQLSEINEKRFNELQKSLKEKADKEYQLYLNLKEKYDQPNYKDGMFYP